MSAAVRPAGAGAVDPAGEPRPRRRVGIFGWGIVAPRSPNIDAFERNLASAETWLAPFDGFGPSNFLVGVPEFNFADYRGWIEERFLPNRFHQLEEKMDLPSLYAIGAFIQALGQNPGLEEELTALGQQAHVYLGSGLGNLGTLYSASLDLHRAQRRWDRFWAAPERNPALAAHLARSPEERRADSEVPADLVDPDEVPAADAEDRERAEERWWHFWAARSEALGAYLAELAEIEAMNVEGEVETGKIRVLKEKQRRYPKLQARWNAPDPPWKVTPNVLWNIHNTPAAQISMLGRITGLAFAPVAACSTFSVSLKLAMDAIARGEARVVVMGATDPPPHPLTVGSFFSARVVAADGAVSKPLTGLRGTHVSGGAAVWILGDYEYLAGKGMKPLGLEPLAVGVSSDAHHIITPTREGPVLAIQQALAESGAGAAELATWDLHATATPGDFLEVATLRSLVPQPLLVSARKGTFGHGMGAGGGWELTAQYLGYTRGRLFPTSIQRDELNPSIAALHETFIFDQHCGPIDGLAGKLSMGIGGINACVISRPWGGGGEKERQES